MQDLISTYISIVGYNVLFVHGPNTQSLSVHTVTDKPVNETATL